MARVDDFIGAKRLAVETLSQQKPEDISQRSGFALTTDKKLRIPYLDRCYEIETPSFDFSDTVYPKKEIPLQEQVLILHYMLGDASATPDSDWIAYREIPGANLYFGPFTSRAVNPLKKVYGFNIEGFTKACEQLNGTPVDFGDAGFEFAVFPYAPVRIILWEGDDEFEPDANILFRESVSGLLSPEDAAWHASLLVYRLLAMGR